MEKMLTGIIACCLLLSCHKDNTSATNVPNPDNSMVGEWQHVAWYISPGTAVNWENVKNGPMLTIKQDSTYQVTNADVTLWPYSELRNKGRFGIVVKGGRKFTYVLPDNGHDTAFYNPVLINKDTLNLVGLCYEGCVWRFIKRK